MSVKCHVMTQFVSDAERPLLTALEPEREYLAA